MRKEVKLGDICNILNGYAFKSKEYVEDGIRVIRITNVQKGNIKDNDPKYYDISKIKELKNYMLKENDLLISLTGNVGRVGLLPKKLLPAGLNQRVGCLRIKDEKNVSIEYLYQYFNSYNFERNCINNSKGIAQKNLSTEWLKNYKMSIPNLDEQNRIVNELKKIQKLKKLKEQQLKELNQLIKSQFVEMFGDIHSNNKKWKKFVKMNEICEINPKKNEISNLKNVMVSFVPMQAVTEDGKIYTKDKRNIEDVKLGFTYFRENDVLFAKITPCMENGKGAVAVNLENKIGFGSTEFHVIRPGKYVNPLWIYTLTATKEFRKQAEMSMTGSAGQKRVSSKYLENYRMGVPPITLQNQFSEIVKQIDKQKFESMIQLKMMEKIYNIINDRRRYV